MNRYTNARVIAFFVLATGLTVALPAQAETIFLYWGAAN
jgi:hypothetical protein